MTTDDIQDIPGVSPHVMEYVRSSTRSVATLDPMPVYAGPTMRGWMIANGATFPQLRGLFGPGASIEPVGSRITCRPAPVGTDEDWLVHTFVDPAGKLREAGFTQDGQPEFYTGSDAGGFRSWRRGDVNVVTTQDKRFFDLFMTATEIAKRLNVLDKGDRIALFQAVLYGVRADQLEYPVVPRMPGQTEALPTWGDIGRAILAKLRTWTARLPF